MGVLVACGGTTVVVAPTPEPELTVEETPEEARHDNSGIELSCFNGYIDIRSDWADAEAQFLDAKGELMSYVSGIDPQEIEEMTTEDLEKLISQFEDAQADFSQKTDSVVLNLDELQTRTDVFLSEYANSGNKVCDEVISFAEEMFPFYDVKISSILLQKRAIIEDSNDTQLKSQESIFDDTNRYLYQEFCDFSFLISQLTDNESISEVLSIPISICKVDGLID